MINTIRVTQYGHREPSKLEPVDSMAELSDLQSGLALGLLGMVPLQRRCSHDTPSKVRLVESFKRCFEAGLI